VCCLPWARSGDGAAASAGVFTMRRHQPGTACASRVWIHLRAVLGSGWAAAVWAGSPEPVDETARVTSNTILFVDDDRVIRHLASRVLKESGHTVLLARSGREAINLLKSTKPDLVIADLVMPDMEGLELVRILSKAKPSLKVIAISGEFDGLFLKAAKLFGVEATLQKPFSPDRLVEIVTRVAVVD
jgi:two-component system, chemotaxis family, chemotaxis protein CheY